MLNLYIGDALTLQGSLRREARNGYVTLEGFWEDPPDYFDKIVWPNYVEEHHCLFKNGNVEEEDASAGATSVDSSGGQISIAPLTPDGELEGLLEWVIGVVKAGLGRSDASKKG